MRPILFTVNSYIIPSYYFFLVLGVIFGLAAVIYQAKRGEIPLTNFQIAVVSVFVIPFAYIMGMVNDSLFNLNFYRALAESRFILFGGLVSFGAILGSLFVGMVCAKRLKLPTAMTLDLIVLAWPLILGFLRIGCLLNGCCHGLETDSFLGVVLPGRFAIWASRYPTQIMLIVFNFALFAWLWPRRKRKAFDGELTLSYLMVYSLGRLVIDAFRSLPRVLGPFSLHQLASMTIFLVSCIIFLKIKRSNRLMTA